MAIVLSLTMAPPLPIKPLGQWNRRLNRAAPLVLAAVAGAGCFWVKFERQEAAGGIIFRERNFFGILSVRDIPSDHLMILAHGNICHGEQFRSPDPRVRRLPMTYFYPNGPIGQVFSQFKGPAAKRNRGRDRPGRWVTGKLRRKRASVYILRIGSGGASDR